MKKTLLTAILLGTMAFSSISASASTGFTGWYYDRNTKEWTYQVNGQKPNDEVLKIDNNLYYFDSLGNMKTGWIQYGDRWIYSQSNGKIVTGWKLINSKWYYFGNAGIMLTGDCLLSDGKTYNLATDGHLL